MDDLKLIRFDGNHGWLEKLSESLSNAHNLPGWGIHPYDTYTDFKKFCGINIEHPRQLLFDIEEDLIYKFADEKISRYKLKVAFIGAGTSVIGGPGAVIGLTLDIEEYLRAVYNLSQELAYTYGILPNPLSNTIEPNKSLFLASIAEETLKAMAIGFGASGISVLSKEIFKAVAKKEAREILNKKVSEKLITQLAKEVGKLFGKQLSKQSISRGVLRIVPVIGGVVAGVINYKSFEIIGKRLKESFKREREEIKKILSKFHGVK